MTFSEELKLAQDFSLDKKFVFNAKKNMLKNLLDKTKKNHYLTANEKLSELMKEKKKWTKFINNENHKILTVGVEDRDWWLKEWGKSSRELKKINGQISFIKNGGKKSKNSFDIASLKQVSLDLLVEINGAGFFKLRDEKTPSVKWYKNTNTWHDFGSDEHGDSIDLIMKLKEYNFQEACKYLSHY